MKIVLVVFSPNGTTRNISRLLGSHFSADGHEVIEIDVGKSRQQVFSDVDLHLFDDADLMGICSPIYHMGLAAQMKAFLQYALPYLHSSNPAIKAFVCLTYAGITSGKALLHTADVCRDNQISLAGALKLKAPHFWHIDGFPGEHTRRMLLRFLDAMKEQDYRPLDWQQAQRRFSYQKLIVRLIYPLSERIGESRNQTIVIHHEQCIRCGRCARECPVNAIRMDDFPQRDASRCMYCYHCTTVCPQDAIECDTGKVQETVAFNKRIVGMEQPPDQMFV